MASNAGCVVENGFGLPVQLSLAPKELGLQVCVCATLRICPVYEVLGWNQGYSVYEASILSTELHPEHQVLICFYKRVSLWVVITNYFEHIIIF